MVTLAQLLAKAVSSFELQTVEAPGCFNQAAPQKHCLEFRLPDSNTGTSVGGTFGKSEIFRTTDGGEHWMPQANPGAQFLFAVSFTDSNNGTAVGDSGTILRTIDGGNSWVPKTSGTTKTLYRVSFTDTNNGTVVGFEFGGTGIILRTTDGGNNWIEQTSYSLPQGATAFYGKWTSAMQIRECLVGEQGIVLQTTNGGEQWASQPSVTFNYLYGVSFTDANTGTAVGYENPDGTDS